MADQKRCAKCKTHKPLDSFFKSKSRKDGHNPYCKECRHNAEKESHKRYVKEWYKNHRDEVISRSKKRAENDPDGAIAYRKKWYSENADKVKANVSAWNERHPWVCAWRTVLKNSLHKMGKKKENKTLELLGYSALDLKDRLEQQWTAGMTWENHSFTGWHIDHIRPVSSFPSGTDPKTVNALSNLRPMWATSRTIDGVFYEGNLNKNARWNL